MPSKSPIKKQKPLQLDCSSLFNHLSLVQRSIPYNKHMASKQHQKRMQKPNLQMINFTKGSLPRTTNSYEWYILVASTPFAISAQLVPVPKTREGIVQPDLIQCTPVSIWTCSQYEEVSLSSKAHPASNTYDNEYDPNQNKEGKKENAPEILTCNPIILIQESFNTNGSSYKHEKSNSASGESLSVSVVLGTTHSRVLCVQLSIFSYVGASGREEGRYVLAKAVESSEHSIQRGGILEPLPLDSEKMIRRKMADSNSSRNNYNHSSMGSSSHNNNDGHSMASGTNATSGSRDTTRHSRKWVPFRPKGGVSSISPLYKCRNNNIVTKESTLGSNGDFVWISYNDGTLVRLPRWAFFPLLDEDYGDVDNDLDDKIQVGSGLKDRLIKARVIVNSKNDQQLEDLGFSVIPLPKFFPSLMSQPLQTLGITPKLPHHVNREHYDEDSDIYSSNGYSMAAPAAADYEFYEAVTFQREKGGIDKHESVTHPTMTFYTNEDQLFSRTHSNIPDDHGDVSTTVQSIIRGGTSFIGGTAALAKGVIGGMFGAVLGRSRQNEEESMKGMEIIGDGYGDNSAAISASAMFPSMHHDSVKLPLGAAIFDMPRQIQEVSIDPVDGILMACSDNLGRVQLIDLSTKQVIRLWKGMRDATCHWIQFPFDFDTGAQIVKYLTIHCKERKVIEIFRMRHGPRVGKFATNADAQIVQCVVALRGDESYTKCFVLQKTSSSNRYVAKELMIHDDELNEVVLESQSNSSHSTVAKKQKYLANHQSLSEGTIQLQLLKQLLAAESAVPSDLDAVYAALTQISAISDLCKALDVLATSPLDLMGVEDSSFHEDVIAHSSEQLNIAMSDEIVATSNNPHLEELRNKIDFHNQLVASYNELHQFETECYSDNDVDEMTTKSRSPWVVEAMDWIETNEEVSGSIDFDLPSMDSTLTFPTWSKGFLQDQGSSSFQRNKNGDPMLYLCDSTRDRKNILLHIFQPLTKDVFIFKTTNKIFEHMGIHKDYEKLLQYYGEWFMSLPKDILTKECLGVWCPTVRWLLDLIHDSFDKNPVKEENSNGTMLHRLYKFCEEASDLPRAFLLASICREAIHSSSKQLEEKTYGKLTVEACLQPWEALLRKLRVCQMIRLRLYGEVIGAFPITVDNVDKGRFSVYEWIARDLLKFSHNQKELASLEIASITSSTSFFPSSLEGDEPSRIQIAQNSCKKKVTKGQPSDTLLHFMNHFGNLKMIATHRALLLSREWGKNPENIQLLQDSFDSLQNIGKDENIYSVLLASALFEIWQVHIRPIYRAILYGFEEVHEVCEEIISPLCLDPSWLQSLNKISMKIIVLLLSTTDSEPHHEELDGPAECDLKGQWPKIGNDMIIEGLMQNPMALEETSLEAHYGVLCAIQLNDDLSLLPMCVNSYESLFMRESFSLQISRSFTANEHQLSFVEASIRRLGEFAEGPNISREYLDDVVSLGRSWGLEKSNILTQFLLTMYERGKDDMVEDLFNSITRLVDVDMFLDNGIAIVCVRLSAALSFLKKVKRCRSILAMLDADTCEWVREQARITIVANPSILVYDEDGNLISLESTLSLILRMKRMSAVNRIDAYALSVMCETLLKAIEHLDRS